MRRSTVLSFPPQLVFPVKARFIKLSYNIEGATEKALAFFLTNKWFLHLIKISQFDTIAVSLNFLNNFILFTFSMLPSIDSKKNYVKFHSILSMFKKNYMCNLQLYKNQMQQTSTGLWLRVGEANITNCLGLSCKFSLLCVFLLS